MGIYNKLLLEEFKSKMTSFEEKFNYFKTILYIDNFESKIEAEEEK